MGKPLPGGNLLGRSGSVLCWPSRSCLCSGEPRGDFSDKSKSDELWRADGTGDSSCRCWYMVAFFSLFLLYQIKWFKYISYSMTLESEQRMPNLHLFTGKLMWQGMKNLCPSELVVRLKSRAHWSQQEQSLALQPTLHFPAPGSHLCVQGTSSCLEQRAEHFCSTEESQAGRKPTNTAQQHLLSPPSASSAVTIMNFSRAALEWPWASPKGMGTLREGLSPWHLHQDHVSACTTVDCGHGYFCSRKEQSWWHSVSLSASHLHGEKWGEKSLNLFSMGGLLTK